jgi:hypothetical protein
MAPPRWPGNATDLLEGGQVIRTIQELLGPPGCEHDNDLPTRSQPEAAWGAQPCRSCVAARTCG